MAKKPLIFLSSTVKGMEKERDAINEVTNILKLPISRCEFFEARKESPLDACLEEARKCDIFIGLYKDRYGEIPNNKNPEKLSITELEYWECKKQNTEMCLFYSDSKNREPKLTGFIDKIKNSTNGHLVKKFKNTTDLKYVALHSLIPYLMKLPSLKENEIKSMNNLISDSIKYKNALTNEIIYSNFSGVAQPSLVKSFKIDELYVPLKLIKFNDDPNTKSDEDIFSPLKLNLSFNLEQNWDEILKNNEKQKSTTTGINLDQKIIDGFPIIIIGNAGSGKTTLMRYVCYEFLKKSLMVPFFIQIRDLGNFIHEFGNESVIDYLKKKYADSGLSKDFFLKQLETGSCVIIFDGLDEIWNTQQRIRINLVIERFTNSWRNSNKIIISSREEGYKSNSLKGNYDIYKIDDLDYDQIANVCESWLKIFAREKEVEDFPSIKKRLSELMHVIFSDENVSKLASNPLMLSVICLVYEKGIVFPKGKNSLYKVLLETLISTWDKEKGIDLSRIHWGDYEDLLKSIANYLFVHNETQISKFDLLNLVKAKLVENGLSDLTNDEINSIISKFEDRSGILSSDGRGKYFFTHLSFLEYFVADHYSNSKPSQIFKELRKNIHNYKYHEIITFVSAKISEKYGRQDTSEFLQSILDVNTIHEDVHLMDLLLVLNCVSNGALVTHEFENRLIERIGKYWNSKTYTDHKLELGLISIINTDLKNKIIQLWKEKYFKSKSKYDFPLLARMLSLEENLDIFQNYCKKAISASEEIHFSMIDTIVNVQGINPTYKFTENLLSYVEDLVKFDSVHYNPLIKNISVFAKDNLKIKNKYFEIATKTKNQTLKVLLIRYGAITDLTLTKKIWKQTIDSLSIKKEYKNSLSLLPKKTDKNLHDRTLMNDFKDAMKNNKNLPFFMMKLFVTILNLGYKKQYLCYIVDTLESLNVKQMQPASICIMMLSFLYRLPPESKEDVLKWLNHDDKIKRRFKIPLIALRLDIDPSDSLKDQSKKIILNSKLNDSLRIMMLTNIRRSINENEKTIIFEKLLDDDKLSIHVLFSLGLSPVIFLKHLTKLISLYQKNPTKNYHILEAIRQSVSHSFA